MTTTETRRFTMAQRLTAEAVGTAMLLAAVVGSGIMGERLASGNVAVALLAKFEAPLFFASRHVRSGMAQAFSEFVATFGLLAVIWGAPAYVRRPCRSRSRHISPRPTGSPHPRRSPTRP